jgi:catechol 2,3-dioxygenase-like lactoylglutathione lyase family enzyme
MNASIILDASTPVNQWRYLMSRVQLALNVADLESAVEFYSKFFGTGPVKRQPGYANFAITDPPLKLVLMENSDIRGYGVEGALNHLGVEVETPGEVATTSSRLSGEGMAAEIQSGTTCCFAVQDKVWVEDPSGAPWEVYTVLADAPLEQGITGDGTCCVPSAESVPVPVGDLPATSSCC